MRWQGKQWGIWPTLLGDDSHSYRPMHMTYCLLHGVSVWPQGFLGRNDMSRKTVNLWQAYYKFGCRQAEWIPYYRAEFLLIRLKLRTFEMCCNDWMTYSSQIICAFASPWLNDLF